MTSRFSYNKAAPRAAQAMFALHKFVEDSGLEQSLLELVKTRGSQISGWNRLAISCREVPGNYQVPEKSKEQSQ